jgi:hypothetical protein
MILEDISEIRVRWALLSVICLVAFEACSSEPTAPDVEEEVFWDATKTDLVATYDAAFQALNAGQGCSAFSNEDGSYAWAESYLLHSLLDMFEATRKTSYLDRFVLQANEVADRTDRGLGLSDYRGRSEWAWSATRYSVNGERTFWMVDDSFIAEPLARFAALVRAQGLDRYDADADRLVATAEGANNKFSHLFRLDDATGHGQYFLEAGFPAAYVIEHPDEEMPLPLNHESAAGRLHLQLWRATGAVAHRDRAAALGKRLKSHMTPEGTGYAWQYFGRDGDALFFNSWSDISHAAMDVRFAAMLAEEGLVFDGADMQRLSNTLLGQHVDRRFRRFVKGDDRDFMGPDPKCGQIFDRAESDAAGLWLPVADRALYAAVFEFMSDRMAGVGTTDPYVLNSLSQVIYHYPALGAPN